MTVTYTELRRLLDRYSIRPRKALGQHFVVDPNTIRRIVELAELSPSDSVVEVGAGVGSLTVELARVCREVVAVESDPALIPALRETCGDLPVQIVRADAMRVDWDSLLGGDRRWVLVANLPYNIAIPLVVEIACRHPQVDRMLVMVQREAAARLAARPGDEAYGLPSLKLSYHAEARVVSAVSRTVFYPRPRVDSALLSVVRRPSTAASCPAEVIFALASRAFAQRRKMLRRSLASVVGEDVLGRAGIDPRARPEELGVSDWERLATAAGAVLLRAPAKLTVELRVTGVREDGYHEIDAEMVTVDLADELVVVPGGKGLEVVGPHAAGTPKGRENLVSRALGLAAVEAWVHLDKRIPPGAGLGGGSADAAAVLRWAGVVDPADVLALGADVPFCLLGGRARVRGVGEVVEPLPHEQRTFTLLTPPLHCDTGVVYRTWDELGGPRGEGTNDLEPAALAAYPELAEWRARLQAETGQEPRLAGSGSTWWVEGAHPGPWRTVVRTVPPPQAEA